MRGRPIRTIWSQLLESSKYHQKSSSKSSKFQVNDNVYIRYYAKGKKWIPGIIQAKIGKHCTSSVNNPNTASFSDDNSQSPEPLNISPSMSQTSSSNTTVIEPASTISTSNQDDLTENLRVQQVRRTTSFSHHR